MKTYIITEDQYNRILDHFLMGANTVAAKIFLKEGRWIDGIEPFPLLAEVVSLLRVGSKIETIKAIRNKYFISLKEARDISEIIGEINSFGEYVKKGALGSQEEAQIRAILPPQV